MPKVSVIIPVYNAEKYLRECIDSVLAQTFVDFEVLLINDGSTDGSGKICDEYAKKDKRIKVFHQENGGVSSARNLGLDNAKGEWITFVDSDDWIGENYFKCLSDSFNEKVDLIFLNYTKTNNTKNVVFPIKTLYKNHFLKLYTIHPHFFSPWAKFFKRKIIVNNHLRFDEKLDYGEDNIFNCEFLIYTNYIYLYGQQFYYQRVVEDSLSSARPYLPNDKYKYERLYEVLEKLNLPFDIIEKNIYPSVSRYFNSIIHSDNNVWRKYLLSHRLLKKYKKAFINDLKESDGRGKYLSHLLKYNLYFIFVFILNLKNE